MLYARVLRGRAAVDAVWFKNVVAATSLGLLAWVLGPSRGGGAVPLDEAGWLAISGFTAVCIGDLLYFTAIAHIGVGRTVILTQAVPALTALTAWPLYGQPLGGPQWLGVLLVCGGGVLAESRQVHRRSTDLLGFLAALGCVATWTIGNLLVHGGLKTTGPVSAGALRLGAAALGFAVFFLIRGELPARLHSLVSRRSWRDFALPTFVGTVFGMSLYAAAFKWAPQGIASALSSALPLFTVPLAVIVLGEHPGWRGWCGATLTVGGVAFIALA